MADSLAAIWLKRAKSNLRKAGFGRQNEEIVFEDLCFDLQQAVEKGLKALCIHKQIIFPRVHDINFIVELLENNSIAIPDFVKSGSILTEYAVETRYPGLYDPVTEEEYLKALDIAEAILKWLEATILLT